MADSKWQIAKGAPEEGGLDLGAAGRGVGEDEGKRPMAIDAAVRNRKIGVRRP